LRAVNFTMVRHARADAPGRVGHFIAIDEKKKIALISVKGTSSLSDFVTDACGTPVRYDIPSGPYEVGGPAVISCHEGVLDASLDLLQDIQPLVEHLFLPSGFKVLLTGHSLGAGVAVIVGAMLRSRLTQLQTMGKKGLEVIAFAPPPTLNYVAAKATSSFTTSVVNGVDVVPRTSINNAVTMLEFLNVVYGKLIDKGLAPKNLKATFELLSKLFKSEGATIMSPDELFKALSDSASKRDVLAIDHLYVPGKVLYIYEKPTDNSTITRDAATAESSYQSFSAAIETDGACAMLQHIDIDQKMLDDHMVFAYKKTLEGFPSSKID
jgi:Lipase (class 3)